MLEVAEPELEATELEAEELEVDCFKNPEM